MVILSIETSCDETAISVVEITGTFPRATYKILGDALFSQIDIHREFGGVFPAVAKREHIATILPMLEKALLESALPHTQTASSPKQQEQINTILDREIGLAERLLNFYTEYGIPAIDTIAVTSGPGLEPALWVGVNFAKALATLWNIPVVPVDHMEGHILASVFDGSKLGQITFPAITLLVSGGHTEMILMRNWGHYEKIGQTRDDAAGEAFDKVARILGLPYPGGPEISRLASEARDMSLPEYQKLPRPMLHSGDLDFSFSGLKTAVRYGLDGKILSDDDKRAVARDFENAVIEVLIAKAKQAIEKYSATSFILGGGVSANTYLRTAVLELANLPQLSDLAVFLPNINLSTDNSIMIALAGHAHLAKALSPTLFTSTISADGNQSLDSLS
jgi:N6-L-threonylcarbamoyladenine synthase